MDYRNSLHKNAKLKNRTNNALIIFFLTLVLILILFPILIVTFNAFKTEENFYATGPFGIPKSFTVTAFLNSIDKLKFFPRLLNSVIISLSTAVLATALSFFNGYALGVGRIKGRLLILVFFLIAMTIPQESVVYPLYYMFKSVKLYNSHIGVILCLMAFNLSFGTYLMGTVLREFPLEYVEAARVDGASNLYILFRIITPLSIPSLSVLFVLFFIWTWNDFFISLIFLISERVQTIPLGILQTRGQYRVAMTDQAAAALLLCLPSIIFFILFQRTMTKGIMASGIKG